jgi:hypothetical protein
MVVRRVQHPVDALLSARGSSKRWLAKKLGMEESVFNRYLYDKLAFRDISRAEFYQRVADVLHVPVEFVTPGALPLSA